MGMGYKPKVGDLVTLEPPGWTFGYYPDSWGLYAGKSVNGVGRFWWVNVGPFQIAYWLPV